MKLIPPLLLIAISINGFGQSYKINIGLEASPSITGLRGNETLAQYNKATIGFSTGAFLEYCFREILSIHAGFGLERKVAAAEKNVTDLNGNIIANVPSRSNFDYWFFPIFLKATFGKKLKYFFDAGPYFGYLIQQNDIYKLADNSSTTVNVTNLDKRFDSGLTSGVGIAIPFKQKFACSIELRDNLGFTNINGIQPYDSWTIRTNSTNLLIGISYKFIKRIIKSVDSTNLSTPISSPVK